MVSWCGFLPECSLVVKENAAAEWDCFLYSKMKGAFPFPQEMPREAVVLVAVENTFPLGILGMLIFSDV